MTGDFNNFENRPLRFPLELAKEGTTARDGRRANVSMSSGVFTVLSIYSRRRARPIPPMSPTKMLNITFRDRFGREGPVGIRAGSTILMFEDRNPAVIPASFS